MSPKQDLAAIENMVRSAADAAYGFFGQKIVTEKEFKEAMTASCQDVFNRESAGAAAMLSKPLRQALAQMVIEKGAALLKQKGALSKTEFHKFSTDVVQTAKKITAPVAKEMMLIRRAKEIKAHHTVTMESDMDRFSDIVTEAAQQEDETSALATLWDLMAGASNDFENEVPETVMLNARDILIDMFDARAAAPDDKLKNSYVPSVAGARAVIGWETFLKTHRPEQAHTSYRGYGVN